MKIKQLLQTIQTVTQPVTQRGQSCPASGLVVRTGVRAGTEVKESGSLQLPISVPILANDPNPDQFAPFAELKVMPWHFTQDLKVIPGIEAADDGLANLLGG